MRFLSRPRSPKEGNATCCQGWKKKGKRTGALQLLVALGELKRQTQMKQQEHKHRMKQESLAFQQKMEKDKIKFEAQLSTSLQQQSSQRQSG